MIPALARLATTVAADGCWSGRPNASNVATPTAAPMASARNTSTGSSTERTTRMATNAASSSAPAWRQRDPRNGPSSTNDAARIAIPVAVIELPRCTPARAARSLAMRLGCSWSTNSIAAFVERAGGEVGDDQVPEQPVAAQREREHEDAEARHHPEQLGHAVEHPRRRGLEEAECVDEVLLEAEHRVLCVAGHEQQERRRSIRRAGGAARPTASGRSRRSRRLRAVRSDWAERRRPA